jgi:hypothetical protein
MPLSFDLVQQVTLGAADNVKVDAVVFAVLQGELASALPFDATQVAVNSYDFVKAASGFGERRRRSPSSPG